MVVCVKSSIRKNPGAGGVAGPAMKYVRTYHSSFLLLSDGSIVGAESDAARSDSLNS